jgi:hypothetical protein
MARYKARLHVTDSACANACTYVSVPVEKGEHLTDAEIERRALARAVELFGPSASAWTLLDASRTR